MKDVELFIITGSVITLIFVAFIVSFLLINQRRHFNYLKEKQHLKNTFQQTLLQSQIEIQEQTFQHIGRELHDNLGQVASLIKINLNTVQLSNTERATEKIKDTLELTRQLIADIKSLSVSLGSDRIAQAGLDKALETEVERLNKTDQFIAGYQLQGTVPEIDKDKAIILYRMAQEVLNNIVKHSGARQINILLTVNENLFTLVFTDDGLGFNIDEKINSGGQGFVTCKTGPGSSMHR